MVEWKKLGDIGQCTAGATPSTKERSYWDNGTIPWMSSGEVHQGIVTHTSSFITNEGYDNASTKMLPKGTVVIALAGQGKTRGSVAITDINLCTNQSLCGVVIEDTNIENKYIYYYLRTRYDDLRRISSGEGTRGGLNLKMISTYPIPLPPLSEQQRIVGILDTFTASIDNLKEQIAQRRKQYEYYRDQLLDLEGKEGVEMMKLGDICFIKNGYTPSTKNPEFWEGGSIPWFTLEDIRKNGRILSDAIKHITVSGVKKSGLFPKESIIISTTATIGEYALINTDFLCNQQITSLSIKAKYKDQLLAKFLYYLSDGIGKWCKKNVNGGGSLLIVSTSKLNNYLIPIPSLSEQHRIVSILDTFESSITNLESQLTQREKQYEYYRNKLLTFE